MSLAGDALLAPRRHWRPVVRATAGLALTAALVVTVVSAAGGLEQAAAALGRVQPTWLVAALAVEAASYVAGGNLLRVLQGPARRLSLATTTAGRPSILPTTVTTPAAGAWPS